MQVHGNMDFVNGGTPGFSNSTYEDDYFDCSELDCGNALKVQIVIGKVMDGGQGLVKS